MGYIYVKKHIENPKTLVEFYFCTTIDRAMENAGTKDLNFNIPWISTNRILDLLQIEKNNQIYLVKNIEDTIDWIIKTSISKNMFIQRYKGLGEMNPIQLWETTMNPSTRRMIQITNNNKDIAEKLFTTLMGDTVEPRKKFIQINALQAKNIDV